MQLYLVDGLGVAFTPRPRFERVKLSDRPGYDCAFVTLDRNWKKGKYSFSPMQRKGVRSRLLGTSV